MHIVRSPKPSPTLKRVLGLDVGIASCGWALIDIRNDDDPTQDASGEIVGLGTWMFDAPETDKERTPTNQIRRTARGQRRVIRRRRQRMTALRQALCAHKLLASEDKDALKIPGLDPWSLRVKALDSLLDAGELAVALGHIARHRGFKSNKKSDGANAADESSVMLKAIDATRERSAGYPSMAAMFLNDPIINKSENENIERKTLQAKIAHLDVLSSKAYPGEWDGIKTPGTERREARRLLRRRYINEHPEATALVDAVVPADSLPPFAGRKRNRSGDYSRSILRHDLEAETRAIFAAQRKLGSSHAAAELEDDFTKIAFFQRPLQDSEDMVGFCPFEKEQKRTSQRAPSFELFRYLSRLNNLRVKQGRSERPLSAVELAAATHHFGKTAKITFKALRKLIGLDADWRFAGVSVEDEKNDVAARKGEAAFGTAKLRAVLGDAGWASLSKMPETLDRIAEILTFRDAPERIAAGLNALALDPLIVEALMKAVAAGTFARFTGAAHISAKVTRALIPFLKQGLVYSEACAQAGYDHAAPTQIDLGSIHSPVARKAMSEAIKQVNALVRQFGVPDAIHVELARDVGKSKDERDEIKRGIDKRNAEKDRLRDQYVEDIGAAPRTAEDLLRYELWKQQNCRCIYTDDYIDPKHVGSTGNDAQVDHILPWSRFGDDSFHNKVLVTARANQEKQGRTPFEWFSTLKSERDWEEFTARVEESRAFRGFKKRNLLLKNADEVADKFRSRNLNDTRYACRALAGFLTQKYPPEPDKRRVFSRPGSITSKLRQAWGVQDMKKDADGKRHANDQHHALDALVRAATAEGVLQRLTRAFQEAERRGLGREIIDMPPPWTGFREQARAAVNAVFVARADRHRARGKAHDATIKQIVARGDAADGNGREIYERKAIDKLTEKELARIKDQARNAPLIESLRLWIEAGKPKGTPPKSPKGDPIRKVRVLNSAKDGVEIRGGIADRGEMVRVDVFRKQNAKGAWQFYLVPVYPHQIAQDAAPPRLWVQGGVSESDWPSIDETYEYLWPVFPFSLLEIVKPDGEILIGYFRGLDRSTGAIHLSLHHAKEAIIRSIGVRNLFGLQKLVVDRLGQTYAVKHEVRTWRGAASI